MMTSASIVTTTPEILGETEVRLWLEKDPRASLIDDWIGWNNSPLLHIPVAVATQFFPEKWYYSFLEEGCARTAVNALLKTKLSWSEPVSWAPKDPLWQIGMIAPMQFQRLAFLGAAFALHQEIAHIIDGAVIRHLREELGEDIIQFVLLSASPSKYLLEPLRQELIQKFTSTIKSAAASMPVTLEGRAKLVSALPEVSDVVVQEKFDIVEALKSGAIMLVDHAFSSKEHGVQKRIATKLPGCFAQGCSAPLPWATQAEQMLNELWSEVSSWL